MSRLLQALTQRLSTVGLLVVTVAAAPAIDSPFAGRFSGASALYAQNGTLKGAVLADSTEKPLANAEIAFPQLNISARSDSSGNFTVTNIKPGRQKLIIRVLGYQAYETWLVVNPGQTFEADFLLTRATALDEVKVRAEAGRRSVREMEFEENRKHTGRFITTEMLEKDRGRPLGTLLAQRLPGLNIIKTGTSEYLSSSRNQANPCLTQIVLNGLIVYRPGMPPFDLSAIDTRNIIGVEYYTAMTVPPKWQGPGWSDCGTTVIWTKD
ncbi:MAG: carboxypeptidase-like regulatory domain-containing protein [Gemmatimonas sp.]